MQQNYYGQIITMKKYIISLLFVIFGLSSFAQLTRENKYGINQLRFEVRTDFDCFSDGDNINSGFTGKYLNFILTGDLTDNLYYAYRQRINNIQNEARFFEATDYLYLGWRITKNISLTAGKEIVAIGGLEYDLAPIDIYFNSRFWDNINCFRFGTNLEITTNDGKNTFVLQFTNSPFDQGIVYGSLYNYSFLWRANFKHFTPVCSFNMFEVKRGSFLNIIALGTAFEFGPVVGYLDAQNRAHGDQKDYFGKDITLIGRVGINFWHDKMQIFVKGGCDINDSQDYTTLQSQWLLDPLVLPGTDVAFYGGGIEYWPLIGKNDIRIHAFFAVSDVRQDAHVNNGSLFVSKEDEISYQANVGLTWRLKFIDK